MSAAMLISSCKTMQKSPRGGESMGGLSRGRSGARRNAPVASNLRRRGLRLDLDDVLAIEALFRPGQFVLDAAGQVFLPFQLDDRVLLRHANVGVAGDFAGLNARTAHLLTPRDIGSSERVRPQAGEIAAFSLGGPVEFLSHRGIPHRL